MNFFGHATVAFDLHGHAPAFLLGAMLPDFCSMARARLRDVDHAAVAAGVAHHHATDAIFHQAPTFLSLCGSFVRDLTERGVDRGGARAVAHIGTELLLDGLLVERGGPREAYLEAIVAGREQRLGRHVRFRRPEHRARFEHVRRRLEEWGIPDGYADPRFVAERVIGALASRPRLALSTEDAARVREFLPASRPRVAEAADSLLSEVADGLRAPATASASS